MYRMLIVDDEKMIVDCMRAYLADCFEMEYHCALSAYDAIDQLRKMRFDIVMTDINMPGMNGLELVDFIKKHWPDCCIIILTGYGDFEYAYRAHQYDNVQFLLKLEEYETIAQHVGHIIDKIKSKQAQEDLYVTLGKHITDMLPLARWNLVEQAIRYGEPLPDGAERDKMMLLLDPSKPVLMIGGKLCIPCKCDDSAKVWDLWTLQLATLLSKQGLSIYPHISDRFMFWLIQAPRNDNLDDLAIYISESTSHLIEHKAHSEISVVVTAAFVSWENLRRTFISCKLAVEHLSAQGLCQVQHQATLDQKASVPTMDTDCIHHLTQLFSSGKKAQFLEILSYQLMPFRDIKVLTDVLPHSTVAAVTLLTANALDAIALPDWTLQRFSSLLQCVGYTRGAQWVNDVLALMSHLFSMNEHARQHETDHLIQKIDKYIAANYKDDISLSTIADHVHYNPSYLSRIYKERRGINLITSITNVRLDHACSLLTSTMLSIQEISSITGFYSPKYFSQTFRKHIGTSPNAYRSNSPVYTPIQ